MIAFEEVIKSFNTKSDRLSFLLGWIHGFLSSDLILNFSEDEIRKKLNVCLYLWIEYNQNEMLLGNFLYNNIGQHSAYALGWNGYMLDNDLKSIDDNEEYLVDAIDFTIGLWLQYYKERKV